ncbi:MAG TPA: TIGR01841 family phasin [Casimicrobiaceae bacterium]|nr:TIGR01841 family phasin [Casimicrobiaceae bacterium]
MAKKTASKPSRRAAKRAPRRARSAAQAPGVKPVSAGDLGRMAKVLTPEQAFELYRANARMALDVIDAAIEGTAKLRKLQFEGEEEARSMQKKAVRHAAEANDPQSLVAAGQAVTQEAVEKAMRYWSQMFDMIVEIQKRLFALIEQQMADVPGAREAKAAMAMMPDMRQAQGLVQAMQGMMSSGGSAFGSMQRVMGDLTRLAQQSMPGLQR